MKKLLAMILLGLPLSSFAVPIMSITLLGSPGSTTISRTGGGTIHYAVTNNSTQTLTSMTVTPNAGLGPNATSQVSLSANTCSSLAPGATCTFDVIVDGDKELPNSFVIAPAVCAYNNQICSRPDGSNRELVNVLTQAYITDTETNTVEVCNVNTTNGNLTGCVTAGASFFTPTGIAITSSLMSAYVTNLSDGTVSVCSIAADGTFSACATALSDEQDPLYIALNPAGNIAYIVKDSSSATTVLKCSIGIGGILGPCSTTGNDFSGPTSIAIHPNGEFAYVTNSNSDSISLCSVSSDGDLTSCNPTGDFAFTEPQAITLLNSTGTMAYITDISLVAKEGLIVCAVNTSNGALSGCLSADIQISNPSGIAVMQDNSLLFFVNTGLDTVVSCPLNSSGAIDGVCPTVGTGFTDPMGIALN